MAIQFYSGIRYPYTANPANIIPITLYDSYNFKIINVDVVNANCE